MADKRGAARKAQRAAAKAGKRTTKRGVKNPGSSRRADAAADVPSADVIGQDVLHGRERAAIYAALTKRLRS